MAQLKFVLELSHEQASSLYYKLETLLSHADGVDIWLAPGGTVHEDEVFLDHDEIAYEHLTEILKALKSD